MAQFLKGVRIQPSIGEVEGKSSWRAADHRYDCCAVHAGNALYSLPILRPRKHVSPSSRHLGIRKASPSMNIGCCAARLERYRVTAAGPAPRPSVRRVPSVPRRMRNNHTLFPARLAELLERRLARGIRIVADEWIEVAGGGVGFSGIGSWSNQAVGLGFAGEVTAGDVETIIDFHASRGVQPKVELAPHAHPSCVARLREAGFVINGFEQVLVRRLGAEAAPLPETDPKIAVDVMNAGDGSARDHFLRVQTFGFRSDETAEPNEHDLRLFPRYMLDPRVRAVMAIVDERPAAAALVEIDAPLAQLFGGSTRPTLRGRGAQRALILARLRLAEEAGCTIAATDSQPGGPTERNAIRLGFSAVYTRVSLVLVREGLAPSP